MTSLNVRELNLNHTSHYPIANVSFEWERFFLGHTLTPIQHIYSYKPLPCSLDWQTSITTRRTCSCIFRIFWSYEGHIIDQLRFGKYQSSWIIQVLKLQLGKTSLKDKLERLAWKIRSFIGEWIHAATIWWNIPPGTIYHSQFFENYLSVATVWFCQSINLMLR